MSFGNDHQPSLEVARRFARALEFRRQALGLTRVVLAQRLDIPTGVLEAWECGQQFPETPALVHWMNALGLSLSVAGMPAEARS